MIKYNLAPYPRNLYIELFSEESMSNIINKFHTINNEEIIREDFGNYAAAVLRVINKKTKEFGYVAVFRPESMSISHIAHESYHIADFILEDLDLQYNYNSANEHIAYLVGYVAGLIDKGLKRIIK